MSEEDKRREMEAMAEIVAQKLMKHIYEEMGKNVANKIFWLAIAVLIALGVSTGIIHLPAK